MKIAEAAYSGGGDAVFLYVPKNGTFFSAVYDESHTLFVFESSLFRRFILIASC
ncbi:MAG: hypothetical protein PUA93_00420 [Eubacteriales bacterium]|nr:hypothetical protein [Eubacteriales bacterium]